MGTDAFDKLDRLRAMTAPRQQTWDLSPKDVAAIQMAVDILELIEKADRLHEGDLETFDADSDGEPKMLLIGADNEFYGESTFECFVKASKEMKGR